MSIESKKRAKLEWNKKLYAGLTAEQQLKLYRSMPATKQRQNKRKFRAAKQLPSGWDRRFRSLTEAECRRADGTVIYKKYLKSIHWSEMRQKMFRLRGRQCETCGSKQKLHVHHLNYNTLFREDPSDLQALCELCHKAEH